MLMTFLSKLMRVPLAFLWSGTDTKAGGLDEEKSREFEHALSNLSKEIEETEVLLCDSRLEGRRRLLQLYFYYGIFYFFVLLWIFVLPRGPPSVVYRPLLDAMAVFLLPLFMWLSCRFSSFWYGRKANLLEEKLRSCRSRQKQKVEELKRMTMYYQTKGLIERYDKESPEGKKNTRKDVKEAPVADNLLLQKEGSKALESRPFSAPVPLTSAPVMVSSSPSWMDRLVDALLGDDRNSQYALICPRCHAHNGLARAEDFYTLKYLCPNCHHLNEPPAKPAEAEAETKEIKETATELKEKVTEMSETIGENDSKEESLTLEGSPEESTNTPKIDRQASPKEPIAESPSVKRNARRRSRR